MIRRRSRSLYGKRRVVFILVLVEVTVLSVYSFWFRDLMAGFCEADAVAQRAPGAF